MFRNACVTFALTYYHADCSMLASMPPFGLTTGSQLTNTLTLIMWGHTQYPG